MDKNDKKIDKKKQAKSLPPALASKIMQAMEKAGAVDFLMIDGISMEPFIKNGEKVIVNKKFSVVELGDIIHFKRDDQEGTFLHRVVKVDGNVITTKGDNRFSFDKPISFSQILGVVTAIENRAREKIYLKEEPWKSIGKNIAKISYKTGLLFSEQMKETAAIIDNNNAENLHNKAFSLYKKGELEKALAIFRQAAALDPNRTMTRINMGEILRQQGRYDEAEIHLRTALEIDQRKTPLSAQAYNILGNTLCNKMLYQESLEEYNSGIDVDPAFTPLYINRSWAFMKLGSFEKAREDLEQALRQEPENYKGIKYLGILNLQQDQIEEAKFFLEKAKGLNENDPHVLNNLALAYYKKDDRQTAAALLKKALSLDPNNPDVLTNMKIICSGK